MLEVKKREIENQMMYTDTPNIYRGIVAGLNDWSYLKDYICDMDYYDFLKTPYWKAIAEKVRYKADYKCQICNSSEGLNVHHRSYENHGDELHHMEDLICICKDCHEKHHFE